MSQSHAAQTSEEKSRQVAEDSRQREWKQPSFLKELFLGRFRLDLIHPYPVDEKSDRPEFADFYDELERFMRDEVDSVKIDATGEYPPELMEGLRKLGAFGMKIPVEYGGLGFTQLEYSRVMELLGSADGSVSALLSAHQSIGVPQPIKLFGSEEQKKRFLPRCAAGAVSAFALTENNVGSDPASLGTTAELTEEGDAYIVSGEKLWCTNGTIADLLVVMARHPSDNKISAFVIEGGAPGVKVEHRCYFMGLKALANAVISFDKVRVPIENRIGREGQGLRIALTTLNTGRLSLPAGCVGAAKRAIQGCRQWASTRMQWGRPVGEHEAIGIRLGEMAATTFAMEAVSDLAAEMSDRGNYDIRLEAAGAKEWNSVRGWEIADDAMQIRGGRGYETEKSLAARGEAPAPCERGMRDGRINRIFEGSSEVMHLFMAREAVDTHLQVAGDLIDARKANNEKLKALPDVIRFYARWYPELWLRGIRNLRSDGFREFGSMAKHLRFVERTSRRLARQTFYGMLVHQGKLQYRQGFLFRAVDVGMELLALGAAVARAQRMMVTGHPSAQDAVELVHVFFGSSKGRVGAAFRGMWMSNDRRAYDAGQRVLRGEMRWMEDEIVDYSNLSDEAVADPARAVTSEESDRANVAAGA